MKKSYLSSERNIALSFKSSRTIQLFLMIFLFLASFGNATTITSTAAGGAWNVGSTWFGGVVPTSTDDVVIATGSTVTLAGTITIGTLTVIGQLNLLPDNNIVNTSSVIVTSPGIINFDKKSHLILPSNSSVQVTKTSSSSYKGLVGDCNNNISILIGGTEIAVCSGGGNSTPTFDEVMGQGGYNTAGTLSGNQYICTYGSMNTTFTSTVSGGTWSSSNTSIATVNSSGVVTAVAAGTATITYSVVFSGVTKTTTRNVYIASGPGAGPASLTGSNSQCQGSTATYTITPDVYSSSYVWIYSGTGATITPAVDGLSASVAFSATATSGNINVQSVNGCGNGGGGKYLYVTIANSSYGGTLPASANGCGNPTGYITNLGLSGYVGTPIRWESSTDNFVSNITAIANTNNNMNVSGLTQTTYYRVVVQNLPCTSISYSSVCKVTVNTASPSAAGVITGTATVCQGQTNVLYSVPTIANATGYNWNLPSGATIVSGSNTQSITVNYSATATTGNVTVQGTNACGSGTVSANYSVTVNPLPSAAGAITGTAAVCQGQANVSYSVTAITNAISYVWAYSGTGATITNGTTRTPTITFAANATSGNLTVYGVNACGNGTISANYSIAVNVPVAAAGIITGTATVCQGQSGVGYSVPVITNATSYTWAYSGTGATITNGTTRTPAIAFSSTATSGNLTVYGVNACGNGTISANYPVTVNLLPAASGTITGTATVCQGQSGVGYSVPAIANATSYTWAYSGTGATFANGTSSTPTITFASNATSGNLTVYGVNSCGNGTISANYPVIVNPKPVMAGAITGTATVCQGQANIGYSIPMITNASSYTWSYSGTGASISGATNTPSISFSTTSTSGTLTVYGVDACGNQTIAANFTITVQAPLLPPTVGTITQPNCITPTGSVVLSGLPASGTINQTGTSANSYTITGTTMTISGLATGTYNFSVSNGACPSVPTGNVVINSTAAKTWSAGAWSPSMPTASDVAVINGNYSTLSNGDINACSLIINAGYTLTIESGKFVTIQNNLTVNIGGKLDVLDQGSLVMVNDLGVVTNNGTTNVRRTTTPYKNYDYVYWSTPVATTNIPTTFAGWKTSYSFEYKPENYFDGNGDNIDDNGDDWVRATTMTPAKGFIVMGLSSTPTTTSTITFNGKVNNGVQKITGVITNGNYLIGNPYPSALNADEFLFQNKGVLDGTLAFWTHNTAIQLASNIKDNKAGSGVLAFTSDDYAYYNLTGGVGTGVGQKGASGGAIPNGQIGSCQGFFAATKASITGTNEIVFNNSMRLSSGSTTNTQFFKTKSTKAKTASSIEKHRVWLNLTNEQGAFKQTLVGYITGATNDYDGGYDGETLDANEYLDFYSVNQNKKFAIQGRALPFDENDEVPIGFRSSINSEFSISIQQTDGELANQSVYLEDKLTNVLHDLNESPYTFTTEKGTFNDRFVLKYKNIDKTLATTNFDAQGNKVLVFVKNKQIKISAFAETIKKVDIYDVSGRQVYQKENVNSNELLITDLASSHQVLIVKITLENGTVTTDKII